MSEFLSSLFIAVITAAVPLLTAYGVNLINKIAENAQARTESTKAQDYIKEITDAITDAVAATSQTYVDSLKKAGKFTEEAQKEAAKKALDACLASISPAAQEFAKKAYGDVEKYLANKIEAEVRKQKNEEPMAVGIAEVSEVRESPDVATVAATAAATAVAVVQQNVKPEAVAPADSVGIPKEDRAE